ncbi:hypothetical protein BH23CHL5_BH23CHL5_21990 [soil metagenome]
MSSRFASPHFTPIDLSLVFNADRDTLDGGLSPSGEFLGTSDRAFGSQTFKGIPFELGMKSAPNVILVEPSGTVTIHTGSMSASYLVFLHAVEDRPSEPVGGLGAVGYFQGTAVGGNAMGTKVADYVVEYADGSTTNEPILRRFSIQQRHIGWGASPFAAVPAESHILKTTSSERYLQGRIANDQYGRGETRVESDRRMNAEHLWLHALVIPNPETPIDSVELQGGPERLVVYGITATTLNDHPLRPGTRQKVLITVPSSLYLNATGELDLIGEDADLIIDLGDPISARAETVYNDIRWVGAEPDVQPELQSDRVLLEYAAHPAAEIRIRSGNGWETLTNLDPVATANRPVKIRVVDRQSGQPVPVRLHMHGESGEYLPPRGYHRKVNTGWFEDNYGEFANEQNQYCYITGECIADLPMGTVFIEITRGYEIGPIRGSFVIDEQTDEVTFTLDRQLHWREKGWVTADTHVHFLSPQTALLEGSAEGVNVVNVLASQWGEMFSNVSDFDGRTTFGARDFGGDGEFLVRVGTEHRQPVLGHISLLGYAGPMIHPLGSGGPSESALGDPLETTMAEWAERCIEQGGLVVMPHMPNPKAENAADIVLDLVHAIEMMTFNPYDTQISPYALYDWYRYLNLGYHLPVVGGSDKMSAASLLGGVRTYAHLDDHEFSYQNWMNAVRNGNTFATVGPLVDFTVDGQVPGSRIDVHSSGGTLDVSWRVESVRVPIERIELIQSGQVVDDFVVGGKLVAEGAMRLPVTASTWLALRVRGSYRGRPADIAAHSSAIQVNVGDQPLFSTTDAVSVLQQIEGSIAYLDTLAPRNDLKRLTRMRATLASAHTRMHDRLHREGIGHTHTPVHSIDHASEH